MFNVRLSMCAYYNYTIFYVKISYSNIINYIYIIIILYYMDLIRFSVGFIILIHYIHRYIICKLNNQCLQQISILIKECVNYYK